MTEDIQMSLSECAEYGKVSRQSIFLAIKKQRLKATMVNGRWRIQQSDYDDYRLNRYNRQKYTIGGGARFRCRERLINSRSSAHHS